VASAGDDGARRNVISGAPWPRSRQEPPVGEEADQRPDRVTLRHPHNPRPLHHPDLHGPTDSADRRRSRSTSTSVWWC